MEDEAHGFFLLVRLDLVEYLAKFVEDEGYELLIDGFTLNLTDHFFKRGKAGLDFAAPPPDGFGVQTGNTGKLADTRTIRCAGQRPNIPSPLRLR